MVARKSQKQESREEECQQLGMGGLSSTLQGNVTKQKYPRFTWGSDSEVQWDLPRWLLGWLGYKCKMRKRVCINAVGSKRLFCKATPVIAAYRVVSLPLHGLLAGLLASILCQVTQEKRTENSMFGSGVSVIVLGVEAFPRQSLVNWQHTPFLTWKLVIAAITTIV